MLISLDHNNLHASQKRSTTETSIASWALMVVGRLWHRLHRWNRSRLAIAALYSLDDAALDDIGLDRSMIESAVRHTPANRRTPSRRTSQRTIDSRRI